MNRQKKTIKKHILQTANTDLVNPLVPKAHNGECQNLLFSLQIRPAKVKRHYHITIVKISVDKS